LFILDIKGDQKMVNHADKIVDEMLDELTGLMRDGSFITIILPKNYRHFGVIKGLEGDRIRFDVRDPNNPEVSQFEISPYFDEVIGHLVGCHL